MPIGWRNELRMPGLGRRGLEFDKYVTSRQLQRWLNRDCAVPKIGSGKVHDGEPHLAEKRLAPWSSSYGRIGCNEVSVACQHRRGVLHHLSRDRDLHKGQSLARRKTMV